MKSEVLSSLGMLHADFEWSGAALAAALQGYTLDGTPAAPCRYPERASGGLIATAEDVARFCIAGMPDCSGQRVLSGASVKRHYSAQAERLGLYGAVFDAYGFGYYTERLSGGKPAVSHGGQGDRLDESFSRGSRDGRRDRDFDQQPEKLAADCTYPAHVGAMERVRSVGMENILLGERLLWALTALVWIAALLTGIGIARGLVLGTVKPVPFAAEALLVNRILHGASGLLILSGLLWCACRRHLFLAALFPAASANPARAALALGVLLTASAAFARAEP